MFPVVTAPTVYGIETPEEIPKLFICWLVVTAPTVYGIETHSFY